MKPKVAFIAFSDIQIEDWKQHSIEHSRLFDNKTILEIIRAECEKHSCPALFCGDLYDNPKHLTNKVLKESLRWLSTFNETHHIYAIAGNHDQSEKNTFEHKSSNYISTLGTIIPWSITNLNFKTVEYKDFIISGIPYITENTGFEESVNRVKKEVSSSKKKKILLIHSDLPGAIDPSGREIGSSNLTWKLSKLFKGFDLVLSGHIHKPQVLRKLNPRVIMLGATHHQRVTDSGTKMGYWLIYDDLTYKFIHLKNIPQFIYLKAGEEKPKDNNFYIEERKTTLKVESTEQRNFRSNNPIKIAKSYLKAKNINSSVKRKLLIKYLNIAEC